MNTVGHIIPYLAGIIDGEGCITSVNRKPHGREKTNRVRVVLAVSMTDRKPLDLRTRPNSKPMFRWSLWGKSAIRCIQVLRPYLLVKSLQADLAMQAGVVLQQALETRYESGRTGSQITSPQTLNRLYLIHNQIHNLNRKGIAL